MITRSAVLFLVILALACTETTPSTPSDTPTTPDLAGMGPVNVGTPAVASTCNGLPNVGSIVKIESTPATVSHPTGTFWVTGAIIRDDASWPGVQLYCKDTNNQVDWTVFVTQPYCLTPISTGAAYTWELQVNCGPANYVQKAIAIPKNLSGTILSTLRDTTLVIK
jgi:hypothetical protein